MRTRSFSIAACALATGLASAGTSGKPTAAPLTIEAAPPTTPPTEESNGPPSGIELVDGLASGGQPDGLPREIVIEGARFLFDRVVPLSRQELAKIAQDQETIAYARTETGPFTAVYLSVPNRSEDELARYLPEGVGSAAPCAAEIGSFDRIDTGGALYAFAGVEGDLAVDGLQAVGDSEGAPIYADFEAAQPFPELFIGSDEGLLRFVIVDADGRPASLAASLAFDGAQFAFDSDVTDAVDPASLTKVGCATAFPVYSSTGAADGGSAELYVLAGTRWLRFTGEGAPPSPEPTAAPTTVPATTTLAPTTTVAPTTTTLPPTTTSSTTLAPTTTTTSTTLAPTTSTTSTTLAPATTSTTTTVPATTTTVRPTTTTTVTATTTTVRPTTTVPATTTTVRPTTTTTVPATTTTVRPTTTVPATTTTVRPTTTTTIPGTTTTVRPTTTTTVPATTTTVRPTTTTTIPATTTTVRPTTTTTTTTVRPTTTTSTVPASTTTSTTPPSPPGGFLDTFGSLSNWTFAHWRNEIPGHGSAGSSAGISGGQARIVAADQNYGDAVLRSAVRYNLSAGGTVAFDVSLNTGSNPLIGYPFVAFTSLPYSAPSVTMDNGQGPTPRNGVYVQFRDNCRVPWGPPQVVAYNNWSETRLETGDQCLASPPAGASNHVELNYSGGVLTIKIDNQVIRTVAVSIPPVGYFSIGVHNHASIKYGGPAAVTATFDNVTYPPGGTGGPHVVFNASGRNATPATVTLNGHVYSISPHASNSGSFAESVPVNAADLVSNNVIQVAGFNVVGNVALVAGGAVVPPGPTTTVVASTTTTVLSTSTTGGTSTTVPATTTTSGTSTSTTVPATTTTTRPSTTTTTTRPSTSTSTSTSTTSTSTTSTSTTSTTTTLPSGAPFNATFGSASDLGLFQFQLFTASNGTPCSQNQSPSGGCVPLVDHFQGEHNMGCASPTTFRDIVGGQATGDSAAGLVYYCAPGGPDTGHFMTAVDTTGIATLAFTPNQVFRNIHRVCWDQNMTNLGEGKWVNVFIVPAADVAAHGGNLAYIAGSGLPFGGIPQRLPPGSVDFTWIRGSIMSDWVDSGGNYRHDFDVWMSIDPSDTNGNGVIDPGDAPTRGVATNPAPRFTICIDDAANTVTIERPNGTTDSYPYNIPFPTGDVRVIFEDASYNPTKHGDPAGVTWHWDNIEIS